MKKISPKKYAVALYEAAESVQKDELPEILNGFVKLLAKKNALKLSPMIIKEFIRYFNERHDILEIEVVSAKELNVNLENKIKEQFIKIMKAKEANLIKRTDASLLGGLVLRINDTVIDGSLKKQLSLIKQSLV
jgi:F-type H+-transporting ATPase subunit delta